MYISHSFTASAILLSFFVTGEAAVVFPRADSNKKDIVRARRRGEERVTWPHEARHNPLFPRQVPDNYTCVPNLYWRVLDKADDDDEQVFCNKILGIPPAVTEVEYVPDAPITEGGSTTTVTQTTRSLTTEVVTVTEATPTATLLPRMDNQVAQAAQANDVFTSVLADPAPTAAAPTDSGQEEAITGMFIACACAGVDPTSTSTSTFTAPTVQTTLINTRVVRKIQLVTKVYTTTETVTEISNATFNLSGTGTSSEVAITSASPVLSSNSSFSAGLTTSALIAASITSSASLPSISPSSAARAVAYGFPVECPRNNNNHTAFIVNDQRWDYLVQCDTAAVTTNELFTKDVSSATECAAECSLINDRIRGACRVATFSKAVGAERGDCLVSGPTNAFVKSVGDVTVSLVGLTTTGDHCSSIDLPANSNSTNTSSILSSLSSEDVALSTPILSTVTQGGGVEASGFTSYYTLSDGAVGYTYQNSGESSTFFVAVAQSSWNCTVPVTPTYIVRQMTDTVGFGLITSIYNDGVVTVISGTSTSYFTAGGGLMTLPPVSASTTGGGEAVTTAGASAGATGANGGGVVSPSATSAPSGTPISQLGANGTSSVPSGTGIQGSASVALSGSFFTGNSTAGAGTLPLQTATAGTGGITVSVSTATSNFTEGGGYGQPPASSVSEANQTSISIISGNAAVTSAGNSTGAFSTGGAGLKPPTTTILTIKTTVELTVPLPSGSPIGGAVNITSIGGTAITSGTGGAGLSLPTLNATNVPSLTAGAVNLTLIGGTGTAISTAGGSESAPLPSANTSLPFVGTPLATSGADNLAISGGTNIRFSTGGGGVITPNITATPIPSLTPAPSINASSTPTGDDFSNTDDNRSPGKLTHTTSFNVSLPTESATIPPISANSTSIPGTDVPANSQGYGYGHPPTVSSSPINATSPTASLIPPVPTSSSQNYGYGRPPPVPSTPLNINSTLGTSQPSVTLPPVTINATSSLPATNTSDFDFSNTDNPRKGSGSRTPTPSATFPVLTANGTVLPPVGTASSAVPILSVNITIPLSTGGSGGYGVRPTTVSSSIPALSFNSSAPIPTAPSSGSPILSTNLTTFIGTAPITSPTPTGDFSNSDANRGPGRPKTSSGPSSGFPPTQANSTGVLPTGTVSSAASAGVPSASLNSTGASIPSATPTSSTNASSSTACPESSVETVSYETVVATIITTSVVPHTQLVAPTCTTLARIPIFNMTVPAFPSPPTVTAPPLLTAPPPFPTYTTSTTPNPALSSAFSALSAYRRAGKTATPEQVAASCSQNASIVFNPSFELGEDNRALGWDVTPDDDTISFHTYPSSTSLLAPDGNMTGRVLSSSPGKSILISQPVTLCPGKAYTLTSQNRQDNILAQCQAEYCVGNEVVYTVSLSESWSVTTGDVVAGMSAQDCSVQLNIRVRCDGADGRDSAGFMTMEFDDVRLVPKV